MMTREQRAFVRLALATASLCLGAMVFHVLAITWLSNVVALIALVSGWQLWRRRPVRAQQATMTTRRHEP